MESIRDVVPCIAAQQNAHFCDCICHDKAGTMKGFLTAVHKAQQVYYSEVASDTKPKF